MRNILPVSLVMGLVAGLLTGGFLNVLNVPVMEWAISLEEAAAAAEAPAGTAQPEAAGLYAFLGTLGMQRIGLALGLAVLGVIYAAVFTGFFHLVRRAAPGWNLWAWTIIAGLLGFWAISLLTQTKYPLNPPGVGEEASLLGRQGFQFLFMALSAGAAAVACLGARAVGRSSAEGNQRLLRYAGIGVAYGAFISGLFAVMPGNPDPIPEWTPESLVLLFRTFSLAGHLLLWLTIALGVAGYIRYRERGITAAGAMAADRQYSESRRS